MPLVIVAFAAVVVCATGVQPTPKHSKSDFLLSRSRNAETGVSASANDTFLGTKSSRPPSCIQNTGISCPSGGCDSSHGKMECRSGQCYCSVTCSSAEGVCQNQANTLVASGIRLKNAQWPAYYLVASTMDNFIHVATSSTSPLARFNLYQLPGQGQSPQNFLLVPQGSPAHSVSVIHRHQCSGKLPHEEDEEADDNATLAGHSCRHTWKAQTQPMSPSFSIHPSVQDVAVQLSQAPHGAASGAITIRGSGKHISRFLFIHEGAYKVITRADDPGLGGYWIPDPPLPFSLPLYDGPPCKHACDSLSVRSATTGSGLLLVLVLASMF